MRHEQVDNVSIALLGCDLNGVQSIGIRQRMVHSLLHQILHHVVVAELTGPHQKGVAGLALLVKVHASLGSDDVHDIMLTVENRADSSRVGEIIRLHCDGAHGIDNRSHRARRSRQRGSQDVGRGVGDGGSIATFQGRRRLRCWLSRWL